MCQETSDGKSDYVLANIDTVEFDEDVEEPSLTLVYQGDEAR